MKISDELSREASYVPSRWFLWAAYGACIWGVVFGALSFYWALGGRAFMTSTLSPGLIQLAVDQVPWFMAVLWITAILKIFAGLVALALVQPWGRIVPGWILLILTWGAGTLLAEHGALFIIAGALLLGHVLPIPASMSETILRWYTYLWGPWFLLGGLLLLIAGWFYLRRQPVPRRRTGMVASGMGVMGAIAVLVTFSILGIG